MISSIFLLTSFAAAQPFLEIALSSNGSRSESEVVADVGILWPTDATAVAQASRFSVCQHSSESVLCHCARSYDGWPGPVTMAL